MSDDENTSVAEANEGKSVSSLKSPPPPLSAPRLSGASTAGCYKSVYHKGACDYSVPIGSHTSMTYQRCEDLVELGQTVLVTVVIVNVVAVLVVAFHGAFQLALWTMSSPSSPSWNSALLVLALYLVMVRCNVSGSFVTSVLLWGNPASTRPRCCQFQCQKMK